MAPAFLVDLTRLLGRLHHATPRGIDRVTLEYALRFDSPWRNTRFCACVSGEWWVLPRVLVTNLLVELSSRWLRPASPLNRCAGWALARSLRRPRVREIVLRNVARPMASSALPDGPIIYLNVSHRSWLDLEGLRNSLPGRDVSIVAMVHDLMPITCSNFFPQSLCEDFSLGFNKLVEQAELLLVNSEHTRREVVERVGSGGRRGALHVEPIPLAVRVERVGTGTAVAPSFVHIGTVDRRKNVELLFEVWRVLSEAGGRVPTLHLVGAHSQELPSKWKAIERHVQTHEGLDDVGVGRLLEGSRALLFPSTAEGFGLPVVEALARGVPALASDLPAIRETVGGLAELLSPDDVGAWVRAVSDYTEARSPRRQAQIARLSRYRAPTWREHFEHLDRVLSEHLQRSSLTSQLFPRRVA